MGTLFSDRQIESVRGIYARPGGKFEAVVTHKSLPPNGKSRLFTDEREARIWKLATLDELNSVQVHGNNPHAHVHIGRPLMFHAMLTDRKRPANAS